jgi:SAM-dependent methyltransferase
MPQSIRQLKRGLQRSLAVRGMRGTLGHLLANLSARLRGAPAVTEGDPVSAADLSADADFDARHGVDTGGVIPQSALDVEAPNWVHGSAYVATGPVDFAAVLAPFALDYATTSFVDLGCGKGRVLLMAGVLPFARVVGVEYSPRLAGIARDNLQRYRGPRAAEAISVEICDAICFEYPPGDLVVFMYHPFDEVIMRQVVQALVGLTQLRRQRVLVLYFKPVYAAVLDAAEGFKLRHDSALYRAYESPAASI